MQKHFNSYKHDHINHQAEVFFKQHKDDCWFREKYDPQQAYRQKLESCGQAQAAADKFMEEFVDELLVKGETFGSKPRAQTLCLDEDPNFDYQKLCNPAEEADDLLSLAPLFGFDANSRTLYLK